MAEKIPSSHDDKLDRIFKIEHDTSYPKEIPQTSEMKRVARPLRHIKHIPVKSLIFYSKNHPPQFSYETKILLPVSKSKLAVQVLYIGLNPVDLKIMNSYKNNMNYEVGIGREYCGIIISVGEALDSEWNEGDEVMGIIWHPNTAKGACESSILVDPTIDIIVHKPVCLSREQASGALFCLGASFTLINNCQLQRKLHQSSNILINGGTTSMGLFTIQLLKYYYNITTKLVIICSEFGATFIKSAFPDISDELLFIDYNTTGNKNFETLCNLLSDELSEHEFITQKVNNASFEQQKFDIIIDFIGGSELLNHSSNLITPDGAYITTVGDKVANYKKDVYHYWNNPITGVKNIFNKILWAFNYEEFHYDASLKTSLKNDWVNKCLDMLESGQLKVLVDRVYDWRNHSEAFEYLGKKHAHGKVILKVENF